MTQPAASIASDEAILSEITVTATRRAATVYDVSTAVSITDEDEIRIALLLTDVFAQLDGVSLQQTTPGQGVAIVRGLKGSGVLHVVDGMRLNNALFRTAPTPWFSLIPNSAVDRVEVVRGSPASLYGNDAVGGVVHAVSRLPRFETDQFSTKREFGIGIDTANQRRSFRGIVDFGSRELAASLSADLLDTGNRRIGGGDRVGPTGYQSLGGRAMLRGAPDEQRSWFIDLQFVGQPATPRIDELIPGFGQVEPASSEFEFKPNERFFLHVQHDYLSTSGVNWKFDIGWQRLNDDRSSREFGSPVRQTERNRSDLLGLTFDASGQRGQMSWLFGIDTYLDSVSSSRTATNINSGSTAAVTPRFPDGAEVGQSSVFGNLAWRIRDNHRLSAGLRYTDVRIKLPDGSSIRPGNPSGDLGWIWDISDTLQITANASAGFRAPNIADIGTLGNRPGNRFNIPNAGLDSENSLHFDAGMRWHTDSWRAEIVAFQLKYDDRIVSVSTGDLTPEGRDIVRSANAARSEFSGIETGFNVDLSDRIKLGASLTYTKGDQSVAGEVEPADRIPPLTVRLNLIYTYSDSWVVEGWADSASRQDRLSRRDTRDPRIDPSGTPGWARIGTRMQWYPGNGWSVLIGVDNILDAKFRTHGSGLEVAGRNFTLGVVRSW